MSLSWKPLQIERRVSGAKSFHWAVGGFCLGETILTYSKISVVNPPMTSTHHQQMAPYAENMVNVTRSHIDARSEYDCEYIGHYPSKVHRQGHTDRIMKEELREERLRLRNDPHRRFGFGEDETPQIESTQSENATGSTPDRDWTSAVGLNQADIERASMSSSPPKRNTKANQRKSARNAGNAEPASIMSSFNGVPIYSHGTSAYSLLSSAAKPQKTVDKNATPTTGPSET